MTTKLVPAVLPLFVMLGCPAPGPGLSLAATAVDFGVVSFGEEAVADLGLGNQGPDALVVGQIALIAAPGVSVAESDLFPVTVEPGEWLWLDLRWSPVEADPLEGQLLLYEQAEVGPRVVRLWGTSLMPEIRLTPETHDFGTVPVGCTVEQVIQIVNIGDAAATVEDWWLDDLSTGSELSLVPGPPSTFTLAEGEEMAVVLHYTPVDLEPDWGELRVVTNVPGEPIGGLVAALSGTGGPASECAGR